MDQRLYGRHVPAGVGDLVAGPYADHAEYREHAAQHDEKYGDGGPPVEPVAAAHGGLLDAQLLHLGAEASDLSLFIRAGLWATGLCVTGFWATGLCVTGFWARGVGAGGPGAIEFGAHWFWAGGRRQRFTRV